MKYHKILLTALLLTASTIAFADGGGPRSTSYFSYYDRGHNLFYSSVDGKVRLKQLDKKGKPVIALATSNIAIYSIEKKTTTYIFDTATFKGSVVDLYFEADFDADRKKIRFNQPDDGEYNSAHIENNFNVNLRGTSNNLVIKVYSFETGTYSLWMCDKFGKGLRKVFDLESEPDMTWHLDPVNSCIRILKRGEHKNEVTEIKY